MKNKKISIFKEFFSSKIFAISMISIAVLIILLLSFNLGIFIGSEKAKFSCRWNSNYYKNFDGPRGFDNQKEPPFLPMGKKDMRIMDSRGLFGSIINVDNNSLTIKDKDGIEKIVLIEENTAIKEFNKDIKITDLKLDLDIVVLGEPNNSGQIIAKLIRVLPEIKK